METVGQTVWLERESQPATNLQRLTQGIRTTAGEHNAAVAYKNRNFKSKYVGLAVAWVVVECAILLSRMANNNKAMWSAISATAASLFAMGLRTDQNSLRIRWDNEKVNLRNIYNGIAHHIRECEERRQLLIREQLGDDYGAFVQAFTDALRQITTDSDNEHLNAVNAACVSLANEHNWPLDPDLQPAVRMVRRAIVAGGRQPNPLTFTWEGPDRLLESIAPPSSPLPDRKRG